MLDCQLRIRSSWDPPALNKLEKVAIRYSDKKGRPLVLIVNNIHIFKNDDEGQSVLLQIQQKAEAWAASGECDQVLWPIG